MTAERTLIDAMARDMYVKEAIRTIKARGGSAVPTPAWYDEYAAMPVTGPGFRAEWEERARDALRALHDHGPTQRMLDAASKLESDCARLNYGGTPSAEDLYSAMLEAELEEGR